MGFRRQRKVYVLDFSDTEYEGLEVRVSGLTTGEYLDFVGLSAPGDDSAAADETSEMLRMLSRHLVSWNLEDEEGEPVPMTFDGLKSNDMRMNMLIVEAWTGALADVPEPTAKKSAPGSDLPVESIPTEML